ncbi:hypothetical protein IVB69_04855 [Flavobacterium sp. J49]|uniref:hypothetical protein n=1 Tax=Flavobacterium sp. J49 TaxID=2718534 RepID=UPI001594CC77|nr:hypothetical protein [Flavobacterium sp. J49]MBF6640798.1 hypothetical protein [Flavobacterium sp. J49]NIC02045.1 hypothetical protein [Flavobacterium sp. J49]
MTTNTILLILLSFGIAFAVSFYQYLYKAKSKSKVTLLLAFLRFFSVFGLLLLLINPIITRKTVETVKTPLPIVIDNSASMADLKSDKQALELFEKLKDNGALNDKFEVQTYQFDADFLPSDTIDFKGTQSNIDVVAKNLKNIYKNQTFPTVLISDGNQTSGEDYVFGFNPNNKVYPLVVGDTTTYLDLRVTQLNVNKYAFHKNQYPVEVFLNYSGTKSINASFKITQGNSVLNEQTVAFSPSKKSATLNVLLPANSVGLQILKATISSKETEKNTYNNTKNFAVEVIDQKTEVALISDMSHPDLGAIKRSIETNAQRKVTILKPNQVSSLENYNILIFYQPTVAFKAVFEKNANAKINTWIITGNDTDFNFLNQNQSQFSFKMSSQKEDYLASFDSQFNLFALDNIGFEQFPPLENPFGTITAKGNTNTLLSSTIRNIATNQPLLTFNEEQGKRSAYLFGENIWKWRADYFLAKKDFIDFDIFLDKTIQYLASNNARKSLVVNHERFYNSGEGIEITAQYFNKNYELDERARLTISVTNTKTKQVKNYDLLRTTNAFQVNLDGLVAGNYKFTVKELNSNSSYSSGFEVLDFDIEKQFVNPDWNKLNQLATQTQGKAYLASQIDGLIKQLSEDESYKAIQKTITKKSPLVDWVWLLVLLALSLAAEWFIRKYNGLL